MGPAVDKGKADPPACCGPTGGLGLSGADAQHPAPASPAVRADLAAALIPLPGGIFDMGTRRARYPADHDAPRRKVKLSPFRIAATACSNAEFARFTAATGHRTLAERAGWSSVFHLALPDATRHPDHPPGLPWWRRVPGASWSAPEGPGSTIAARLDHPVVHVAWFDAWAYCTWAGLTLPTEAQWEYAARGGLVHRKFPWGDALHPGGCHAMNIWQGHFPLHNSAEDGFALTAPVTAFAPNGFGLYNTCGNVWEWAQDFHSAAPPTSQALPPHDPTGPRTGHQRIQRGGSYLCHDSYCARYHVHSRSRNDPDSSTSHAGFRVALGP